MKFFITMPVDSVTDTFFTEKSLAALNALGEVARNPYDRNLTAEEVAQMAQDADVLLTGWGTIRYTEEVLQTLPNLKMIAHTAGSIAPVVDAAAFEKGIIVIGGNNVFAKSVAEGTLAYILASLRRMEHYSGIMRAGGWKEILFQNRGLRGKKVGVVGFGTITKYFLELIRWFGCEVLIYSSHIKEEEAAAYGGRPASLEEIFSTCDIVSIHTSLTPKNIGMITRELLSMLKPTALLVNTARGAIIDEPAMFEMLLEGRFTAALDVYAEEPPRADNPIRQCENVLLMPHMGGPTIDMREEVVMELCRDFVRYQNGQPLENAFDISAVGRMSKG